jgi:hypothetical protein
MLDQVVPTREAIAILADTPCYRTILKDRVMDTGLMAFQIGRASEGSATVTGVRLHRSRQKVSVEK